MVLVIYAVQRSRGHNWVFGSRVIWRSREIARIRIYHYATRGLELGGWFQ